MIAEVDPTQTLAIINTLRTDTDGLYSGIDDSAWPLPASAGLRRRDCRGNRSHAARRAAEGALDAEPADGGQAPLVGYAPSVWTADGRRKTSWHPGGHGF